MKKIFALLLAFAMIFALAACGGSAPAADPAPAADAPAAPAAESDLAYVQSNGKLVVGITDFAPMDYRDDSGEWIGFDADLAKAFAKSIGVEVEFIEIDWDNKILELNAKAIDCVWNGMTLTDEVLKSMSCSVPYARNAQVVVMKADAADQYSDAESMAGLSFAVEAGSAGEEAAVDAGFDTVAVSTQADALMGVAAGTSDACVIDLLMAVAMTGEGTSYADLTYTLSLNEEQYGIGFRQGSNLVDTFNEFYAAAYADGTVDALADTYELTGSTIAP